MDDQRMNDDVVARLISRTWPGDAVASYYAREHPDSRIIVVGEFGDAAVLVEATGRLGPVAVLRADGLERACEVLARATPGERYVMTPWRLRAALLGCGLVRDPSRNLVFWMGESFTLGSPPAGYTCALEDGQAAVRHDQTVVTTCRCIWRSSRFAEVQVETEAGHRRRGLARAAVSALGEELLRDGITPLYVTSAENEASRSLARSLALVANTDDEFAATVAFSG
jgi:hypothetical protein